MVSSAGSCLPISHKTSATIVSIPATRTDNRHSTAHFRHFVFHVALHLDAEHVLRDNICAQSSDRSSSSSNSSSTIVVVVVVVVVIVVVIVVVQ
jgi:hypothetical protein